MNPKKMLSLPPPIMAAMLLLAGCGGGNQHKQVAEVAQRAADRQAQQNNELARLNREVAEGTRRMIEADAEARKDLMSAQAQLQGERNSLKDGFDRLESERVRLAEGRKRDSLLAPTIEILGFAAVAIAVIAFCVLMLMCSRRDDGSDADLTELLLRDVASEQPKLLIGHSTLSPMAPDQFDQPTLPSPPDHNSDHPRIGESI